jgi:threonine dehydrogenase-like Zn-dependent dehydrogenase
MGPVGIGTAMLARAMGAEVVGVEASPERRALSTHLGFSEIYDAGDHTVERLMERTEGHGFEVAIDCSGAGAARRLCLEVAREWGRVAFVGEGGTVQFEPSPLMIHKQLTLHGSWVCSLPQMEDLVELLVRWNLHPEVMVTHRFTVDQAREAYETFDTGTTGKVAIVWE